MERIRRWVRVPYAGCPKECENARPRVSGSLAARRHRRLLPGTLSSCYRIGSVEGGQMQNSINRIRTIALVGQAGSGKPTRAEALLAKAGAVHAAGTVERGTTVCDYSPGEKQLRHSLKLAVASFEAKVDDEPVRVHLLDTPGYPAVDGHALPALAAGETAAVGIHGQNGIEILTS